MICFFRWLVILNKKDKGSSSKRSEKEERTEQEGQGSRGRHLFPPFPSSAEAAQGRLLVVSGGGGVLVLLRGVLVLLLLLRGVEAGLLRREVLRGILLVLLGPTVGVGAGRVGRLTRGVDRLARGVDRRRGVDRGRFLHDRLHHGCGLGLGEVVEAPGRRLRGTLEVEFPREGKVLQVDEALYLRVRLEVDRGLRLLSFFWRTGSLLTFRGRRRR